MKTHHGGTENTKMHRAFSVRLHALCASVVNHFPSLLVISLVVPLFVSCGQKKDQLPTDMVNIPASASQGIDKSNLPVMKFDEEVFDFGTVTQGEKVSHEFKFENTGDNELIISNAYADCGCTVAEVPKRPIASGESSMIRITFDSSRKTGIVTKSVTIVSNCIPNKQVIKIKATIFVPQPKTK